MLPLGSVPLFSTADRRMKIRLTATNEQEKYEGENSKILTNAVLKITYDGSHFHGWSAANDNLPPPDDDSEEDVKKGPNGAAFLPPLNINQRSGGRRRKRGKRIPGITNIRSVEGVMKKCLAKIYGNVDPARVQVDGCSRTDKGVHAKSMIAQMYCLNDEAVLLTEEGKSSLSSIPGKRLPHPTSSTDKSLFMPLPFESNLGKMMYVLNRMLPPDVRVSAVSETPAKNDSNESGCSASVPFHPSLDTVGKTYLYTFSIGDMHDPMRWRHVWHVDGFGRDFDLDLSRKAANALVGEHDFVAFRGAFRGSERGRVQDTVCTLSDLRITEERTSNLIDAVDIPLTEFSVGGEYGGSTINPLTTYTVSMTGDRFLYKMGRFLVGTIVAVGHGKISVDDVKYALDHGIWESEKEGGKGKKQHICAPAHGLVLNDVQYDDEINFHWTGSNRWSTQSRQEKHSWESA
mmetsp:Transcript_33382/g.48677  ORF Transcript_33382/g.48677 Transcript_33382/m.48677 type:complete len:460 (-) Transcript_33382:52-1431(-)